MSVSIKLRSATQPKWRGTNDVEPNSRTTTPISGGMAMIDRTTKICHSTKSELIDLTAASPSEKARLPAKMEATASLTLSATDESDARNRFRIGAKLAR
jgi:hypothetical protein